MPQKQKKRPSTPTSKALKAGYRSGLEEITAEQIKVGGLEVSYEEDVIGFEWPSRKAKYHPDFKLPKDGGFFYVETKGRWVTQDRHKILLVLAQHPDLDLRMVFSNANAKLYKGSPTSYAKYCDKHGIRWANKRIPEEWLQESKDAITRERGAIHRT